MKEQEMRARIARVIADIDAGRVRVARGGPGRYLGSTVLVATMSLSACTKEAPVEPKPGPDGIVQTSATAEPVPEPVSEYAVALPDPVPEYAAIEPDPEPSAAASAEPTSSVPTARVIRHPPLPYMAPDP